MAIQGFPGIDGVKMEELAARNDGRGIGFSAGELENGLETGFREFLEQVRFGRDAIVGGPHKAGPLGGYGVR